MESESGEDGKCVRVRCAIAQGHGTSLPGTAGHGIATSEVHMGIIVKLSVTLP